MKIYIESSVNSPRRKNGVVGYILEDDHSRTFTQFGSVTDVTENESLLKALKYALKKAGGLVDIEVWTDNQYVAGALEQDWPLKWSQNDWKTAKGKDVANRADWEEIAKRQKGRAIRVHCREPHSYKNWLKRECERRARKYV